MSLLQLHISNRLQNYGIDFLKCTGNLLNETIFLERLIQSWTPYSCQKLLNRIKLVKGGLWKWPQILSVLVWLFRALPQRSGSNICLKHSCWVSWLTWSNLFFAQLDISKSSFKAERTQSQIFLSYSPHKHPSLWGTKMNSVYFIVTNKTKYQIGERLYIVYRLDWWSRLGSVPASHIS